VGSPSEREIHFVKTEFSNLHKIDKTVSAKYLSQTGILVDGNVQMFCLSKQLSNEQVCLQMTWTDQVK
jgi:hypothetical protein